jgi:hypothetical protein
MVNAARDEGTYQEREGCDGRPTRPCSVLQLPVR